MTTGQLLSIMGGAATLISILVGAFALGRLTERLAAIEAYKGELAASVARTLDLRLRPLEEDLRSRHSNVPRVRR